jgi:cation transport ATPase
MTIEQISLAGLVIQLSTFTLMVFIHSGKSLAKMLKGLKKRILNIKLEIKIAVSGIFIGSFWDFLDFIQTPLGEQFIQTVLSLVK